MAIEAPYPDLDELLTLIGEAGQRLSDIEASEGAAGNISVFVGWTLDPRRKFPIVEDLALPEYVPSLVNCTLLVTGSGRRLREVRDDPLANLGILVINGDGRTAKFYSTPRRLYTRLTSELNS